MKLIGITSSASDLRTSLNTAYHLSLTRPGIVPVGLPIFPAPDREVMTQAEYAAHHKDHIDGLVEGLSALVVSGGVDLSIVTLDQPNWAALSTNSERDFMELSLIDAFIAAGKPILGICRGYQAINVRIGVEGFMQDLGETGELHNAGDREIKDRTEAAHSAYVYGEYRDYLRGKTGRDDLSKVFLNSWHHQGWCLSPTGKLPKVYKGREMKRWKSDDWLAWFNESIAAFEQVNDVSVLASTNMVIEGVEKPDIKYVGWAFHPEEYLAKGLAIQYFLDRYVLPVGPA